MIRALFQQSLMPRAALRDFTKKEGQYEKNTFDRSVAPFRVFSGDGPNHNQLKLQHFNQCCEACQKANL